jgi:hypothetical protein
MSLAATNTYVPLAQSVHAAQVRGAVVEPWKEAKKPTAHRGWDLHAAWPVLS